MTTEFPAGGLGGERKRRHFRGYRRFKVVLLALGIAGLILGVSLAGGYFISANVKLLKLGVLYVCGSLILLGLRGLVIYMKNFRSGNE